MSEPAVRVTSETSTSQPTSPARYILVLLFAANLLNDTQVGIRASAFVITVTRACSRPARTIKKDHAAMISEKTP